MVKLAFLILAAIALVSAVMVVVSKNIIHSAISLIITLFSVGSIFVLLHAEFLAATQILIYVGAIMILMIFTILMIDINKTTKEERFHQQYRWALGIGVALTLEILLFIIPESVFTINPEKIIAESAAAGGNTQLLGKVLFTKYLFAFEFASIVIMVAIIAAVFFTRRLSSAPVKESEEETAIS